MVWLAHLLAPYQVWPPWFSCRGIGCTGTGGGGSGGLQLHPDALEALILLPDGPAAI